MNNRWECGWIQSHISNKRTKKLREKWKIYEIIPYHTLITQFGENTRSNWFGVLAQIHKWKKWVKLKTLLCAIQFVSGWWQAQMQTQFSPLEIHKIILNARIDTICHWSSSMWMQKWCCFGLSVSTEHSI